MKPVIKNIEASVRGKLQDKARKTNRPFAEVLCASFKERQFGCRDFQGRMTTELETRNAEEKVASTTSSAISSVVVQAEKEKMSLKILTHFQRIV